MSERTISVVVMAVAIAVGCGSREDPGTPTSSGGDRAGEECAESQCDGPRPASPSRPCPDGVTIAGPACLRDAHGRCGWTERACPGGGGALPGGGGGGGRMCGGMQGLACADGEVCVYAIDAHCGAADQSGTCEPRPEACAEIFHAVCGCDGRTYGNECEAHRAGTSVASDGECPGGAGGGGAGGGAASGGSASGSAGSAGRPCGSRGMAPCGPDELCDYPLDAQCGATDRPGTCAARPRACTRDYRPVCGCDGQTHPNACTARSAGTSIAHDGPC